MKNFHQNLLIVLASALCGLCAWQWYEQAQQRITTEKLNELFSQKLVEIQGYTNSIKTLDGQIAQMDSHISDLKGTVKTNAELILTQKRELNQLSANNHTLTNEIVQYKDAVTTLEAKLKEAYGDIQKQNDAIKDLISQRNEFVQKFNDSVRDRNNIVAKYNDLAVQAEKLQEAGSKSSGK